MRFTFQQKAEINCDVELTGEFIECLENKTLFLKLTKNRFFKEVRLVEIDLVDKPLAIFRFNTATARDLFFEYFKDNPMHLFDLLKNQLALILKRGGS